MCKPWFVSSQIVVRVVFFSCSTVFFASFNFTLCKQLHSLKVCNTEFSLHIWKCYSSLSSFIYGFRTTEREYQGRTSTLTCFICQPWVTCKLLPQACSKLQTLNFCWYHFGSAAQWGDWANPWSFQISNLEELCVRRSLNISRLCDRLTSTFLVFVDRYSQNDIWPTQQDLWKHLSHIDKEI